MTAQQLRKPDFLITPHLGHAIVIAVVMGVVVAADVGVDTTLIAVVMGGVVAIVVDVDAALIAVVMGSVVAAVVDVWTENKIIERQALCKSLLEIHTHIFNIE